MNKSFLSSSLLSCALLLPCAVAMAGGPEAAPSQQQFGVSLTGLYLKPGANNLDYAVYTAPLPVPAPNWSQRYVKPNYHGSFDLGFIYAFDNGVDSIKADWLYFNSDSYDSASASGSNSVAPPYYFGPGAQRLRGSSASTEVNFDVNSVNVLFDHKIQLSHRIQLNPFAGINYAYLRQKMTTRYDGTNVTTTTSSSYSITSTNTSKYNGVGPRLGVNATGLIADHFSVVAGMAASLLIGSLDTTSDFTSSGSLNPTPANTSLANMSQTQLVPELDSNVALQYAYQFQSGSSVSVQAGYMYSIYIDGINQVVPTDLVADALNNGVIAIKSDTQQQSNLSLNGPFVKLTWMF